jgi:hypothetical protein
MWLTLLITQLYLSMFVGSLAAGSGLVPKSSPAIMPPSETIIMFFYLVNKSGQGVKVRVVADGRELFDQEIHSKQDATAGTAEAPPPGRYPARELKVPLDRRVKRLTVEELLSGMRAQFEIANFSKTDAGFRITIGGDKILLDQDYLPIH